MGKYEDLQKASNASTVTVIVGGLITLAGAAIKAISKKAAKDKLEKDKMKKDEINELTKDQKLYRT